MLKIDKTVRERFNAAKKLARKFGLTSKFAKVLNYLRTYAEHRTEGNKPQVRVTLGYDFAPYSFSILWERFIDNQWKYWFNGGLIYHGPHDRGGDGRAPTYSVSIEPHHGWSIHT